MAPDRGKPRYSIAAVSKLTGVSCHALRAWERRHGFPAPERSASGQRRYAADQVEILARLARLGKSGHSIGQLIAEYRGGMPEIPGVAVPPAQESPTGSPVVDQLFGGDAAPAEALIDQAAARMPPLELVERVIGPALVDVGERWFRGECPIFRANFATRVLRSRLARILEQAREANPRPARSAIVGSVAGDQHEGGILMVGIALELAGWRAVTLGTDLPVEQFRGAVERWRPDAVAVSMVLSRNITKRFEELARIRGVPVFLGGRGVLNHQALARRHGLIPLVGSLAGCSRRLIGQVEGRAARATRRS